MMPLRNFNCCFFFSDEQHEIISKNTNESAKIGETHPARPAQGGGKVCAGHNARPARRWTDSTVSELYGMLI